MPYYPTIQEQIENVRRTTRKALRSKKAALEYLVRAGIVKKSELKEFSKKKK